jgi:hypothetical protein
VNADINGVANIIRKVYRDAFASSDIRTMLNPTRIRIGQYVTGDYRKKLIA